MSSPSSSSSALSDTGNLGSPSHHHSHHHGNDNTHDSDDVPDGINITSTSTVKLTNNYTSEYNSTSTTTIPEVILARSKIQNSTESTNSTLIHQ